MNRRLASPARGTTPAVAVLGPGSQVNPSAPVSTCTRCGRAKPVEAYARWGLGGGFLGFVCGARSACDDCLDEVTRFPADMPLPVMIVEIPRVSGAPGLWRLSA